MDDGSSATSGPAPGPVKGSQVVRDVQGALLTRQVLGERQLLEVMTDFWLNHFNVNIQSVSFVVGDYVERVIRPNALGRFETLLVGVASHPAMLIYLDNRSSSVTRPGPKGPRGGLNENYARELLELHTVGVDGGYTQQDVIEVARVLSGWGVEEFGFAYRDAHHDRGEKVVMGRRFPSGGSHAEGVDLLRWLAVHPSTAHFICRKLAQRFVADEPPPDLVERLAATWTRSGGDVKEVLRALYRDPAFWAPEHRGNKVKTPLEWWAGTLRALGASSVPPIAVRMLDKLGQPPVGEPVPTGYAETADVWAHSAQLATRWQLSMQLARGRLPGLEIDLDRVLGEGSDAEALTERLGERLLGGGTPTTRQAMREYLAAVRKPARRREDALALALSTPEFQHQ